MLKRNSKTIHTHAMLAGKYRIEGRIAAGGMGKIYRALQGDIERTVAVKIIDMTQMSPDMEARFKREIETLAKLEIPNVIPIYDYDKFRGHYFYVMPLLRGGTLKQRIELRTEANLPLPSPGEVSQRLQLVAQALHRVHQKGIIHRDIKPSNIVLDDHGQPFIIDFGIAREANPEVSITYSGARIGTEIYMCLAQANGMKPTYAFDLYSLAVTFYEVLTGYYPFKSQEEGYRTAYFAELASPNPTLQNWRPDLSDELKEVFRKALSQNPDDMYPDLMAFAAAFAAASQPLPNDETGFFTFKLSEPTVDIHDQPSTLHTRDSIARQNQETNWLVLADLLLKHKTATAAFVLLMISGMILVVLVTRPIATEELRADTTETRVAIVQNPTTTVVASPIPTEVAVVIASATTLPTPTMTLPPTACDLQLASGVMEASEWRSADCIQAFLRTDPLLGEMVLVPCFAASSDCTPIWVNRYEITRGYAEQPGSPELPWAGEVTGNRANNWCQTNGGRLLTEMEWRHASGAAKGWMFPWGNEPRDDYPTSGNAYAPSAYPADETWSGVIGMGGNVSEWIQGSRWMGSSFRSRDLFRIDVMPQRLSSSSPSIGFRCAQDWDVPAN